MEEGKNPNAQRENGTVTISAEEAVVMRKVRVIVQSGQNAEIKKDASGKLKVYRVSKIIA